ncbi:mesoderm-specific transcript protein-like isoform X1 [Lingula anatina]|uniref:Mesoderm-specific transcript protein-like isoform X1 n=1 Tax=Lingula anatina TaxID=7574 RepID=A0A1S3H884_LINAN|nr:mesoderm-specific transcript protein-like isoform X1 [Lingula anatina]XP_013381335.1 mesoderm-specific transcript protein-like isoform X1 [Lingula anatina]XP_013381336.1 mesoderm-specific transcript protein-like isoform X1 [Lingula anatina]XP_013381337.1 mesoderm-specific transcript protein-like isoform X1 [Lingula anatina]XP_013381338.1 mesoderm-specific transcript protein-like isoform X1 [Lingula anatina]|eukprot:XP_013381334.1 mesoderm-specific transcript protein-like isoform X1 [Lingula anatina]
MSFLTTLGVGVVVVAVLLGIYVNFPPPQLSPQLQQWKDRGEYHSFKGHQIFYIDERGDAKSKEVLLMMHGYPTMSYDFSKMWKDLKGEFGRLIVLDFLGFGFSDKPAGHNYSVMEQADIAEHLMGHLGIDTVHILAHDLGDTYAQEVLSRYEDRLRDGQDGGLEIESVCLMNGGMFPETNHPTPNMKLMLKPYLKYPIGMFSNRFMFKRGLSHVFGPYTKPTPEDLSDFWAATRYNEGNFALPRLIDYILERAANKDRWTGALQNTRLPVHVIYGPADPINPPPFIDFYKKTVPRGSITVLGKDISHYPLWEDPQGVFAAYKQFIDKVRDEM